MLGMREETIGQAVSSGRDGGEGEGRGRNETRRFGTLAVF